jgi:hypothetical protein
MCKWEEIDLELLIVLPLLLVTVNFLFSPLAVFLNKLVPHLYQHLILLLLIPNQLILQVLKQLLFMALSILPFLISHSNFMGHLGQVMIC